MPGPGPVPDAAWTDSQLLEAFVRHRDEMAFTTLVTRHGPRVWQICRRTLFSVQDTEDAFQATFLVLAQKAARIDRRELLANWLHGVADRVAKRARIVASRRRSREGQSLEMVAHVISTANIDPNIKRVVHEEVSYLPAKYRVPVLLCYLKNRTHLEAAQELCCPIGTVKGRLSRALETLRSRLARRGLALSTGLVATALAAGAAEATVPATLLDSTVRLGLRLVTGKAALEQIASPQVAALSKGIEARGWLPRLLRWAWAPLTLVLIGSAVLWISGGKGGGEGQGEGTSPSRIAKGVPLPAPDDKAQLEGTWKLVAAYRGGQALPKMAAEARFVFSGDRLTANMPGLAITDYAFSLDPNTKPKAMDLRVLTKPLAGSVFLAVYELDRDVLKLCMPDANQRPAEVASKPNTGHILMVLQRQPK